MFWSRNFYVETGLNGHGQNSGCRRTASERDADRKESLEQSVEIIGKKREEKKSLEWKQKKGRIGMNEIEPSELLSFPKRETWPAKRRQALSVWPVSHAHGLSLECLLFITFFEAKSQFCLLKPKKKKPRHAGKTKAAEGRRVTGVSEV